MEEIYNSCYQVGDGPIEKGMWHRVRKDDFGTHYVFLMDETGIIDGFVIDLEDVDSYLGA